MKTFGSQYENYCTLQTMKLPVLLYLKLLYLLCNTNRRQKKRDWELPKLYHLQWSYSHILVLVLNMNVIFTENHLLKCLETQPKSDSFLYLTGHYGINGNVAALRNDVHIFPCKLWNCCKQALISCAAPRRITTLLRVSPSLCNFLELTGRKLHNQCPKSHVLKYKGTIHSFLPSDNSPETINSLHPRDWVDFYKQAKKPPQTPNLAMQLSKFSANVIGIPKSLQLRLPIFAVNQNTLNCNAHILTVSQRKLHETDENFLFLFFIALL